jgi:hypothetical protein
MLTNHRSRTSTWYAEACYGDHIRIPPSTKATTWRDTSQYPASLFSLTDSLEGRMGPTLYALHTNSISCPLDIFASNIGGTEGSPFPTGCPSSGSRLSLTSRSSAERSSGAP